jgi:hypothetical protein
MATLYLPNHDEIVSHITQSLNQHGLQIIRSFELQTNHATCQCGQCFAASAQCQCQLTVFLVYGAGRPPVTLMAHQRRDQTWFSLVNSPQQPADPELEAVITAVLAQGYSALSQPASRLPTEGETR